MTETPSRDSFVARFGEDQAAAIERTVQSKYFDENSKLAELDLEGPHAHDDFGTDSFRYWFMLAIAELIVTDPAKRRRHGITADVDEMKAWARSDGDLASHDGDCPDYLAALFGVYAEWVAPRPERPGEFRVGATS